MREISVDGFELAEQAIRAGLVNEFQMIFCPAMVDGGTRFFLAGVQLNLNLREARRFRRGVVVPRYGVAPPN